MKGFKSTGYGPSAGFKYPASMGFTGSTGSVTNVSPHVRRIGFAKGGYVSKTVGDSGSAMVRRAKPSTEADREYGGKTPLAPGFARGGRMGRVMKLAIDNAQAKSGAPATPAAPLTKTPRRYTGGGALGAALAAAAASRKMQEQQAVKRVPTPGVKGRFYDKGGKVKTIGTYEHVPKPKYWDSVKYRIKEMIGFGDDDPNAGMAKRAEKEIKSRTRKIDEAVDNASYSRGGKAKRMGYAKGGEVTRGEAKKIAEKTVGEHVRYPAPKGHKGLKAKC